MKKRQTDGLLCLDDSRFDIQRRPLFPRMPLYRLFYVSSMYIPNHLPRVFEYIFIFLILGTLVVDTIEFLNLAIF